jgi:hypothetical protein
MRWNIEIVGPPPFLKIAAGNIQRSRDVTLSGKIHEEVRI